MKSLFLALILGIVTGLAACNSSTAVTSTITLTSTTTSTSTLVSTVTSTQMSTVTSPTTITITSTMTSPTTITSTITIVVTTSATTTPATSTTTGTATFSQLALSGRDYYYDFCARCHTLIGAPASGYLAKYGDAGALLNKIKSMPASLTQEQEWWVLSYLLVENNLVSGDIKFDPNTLSQIRLAQL